MSSTKTSTWIFIEVLSTIGLNQEQPKCASAAGWINHLWHIHTMAQFLAIKRHSHTTIQDESRKQQAKWKTLDKKDYLLCDPTYINNQKRQNLSDIEQICSCQGQWALITRGMKELWGTRCVFYIFMVVEACLSKLIKLHTLPLTSVKLIGGKKVH